MQCGINENVNSLRVSLENQDMIISEAERVRFLSSALRFRRNGVWYPFLIHLQQMLSLKDYDNHRYTHPK